MQTRVLAGVLTLTAVAVLMAGAVAGPVLASTPPHSLRVSFPTADGLLAGGDVLEAGARVGGVDDIGPEADGTAVVTMTIDPAFWPLHRGAKIAIRPKSLLGEKYVAITDGKTDAAALDTSGVIRESGLEVPVELDQFINSLDPSTRQAAQTLLNDLGAGVAGTGPDLNSAIATARTDLANLAVTGRTLNGRDADLDRILISLDDLLGTLSTNDQLTQIQQLIDNGRQVVDALAAEQQSLRHSFTDADAALAELNAAFDTAVPALRQTLDVAPSLVGGLNAEAAVLAQLAGGVNNPVTLGELIAGIQHGPTATGGALELGPNGAMPIFRICLLAPGSSSSCTGNGFTPSAASGPATNSSAEMAAYSAEFAS